MTVSMLLAAALILFVSSTLQSIIGFAFNLLAVPLLLWNDFSLAQAVALTSIPILVQVSVATWKLRSDVPWREVFPAATIRYLSLPVGVSLLYWVNSFEPTRVKQIVGLLLLIILGMQSFAKIRPRERLAWGWDLLAFGLSGVMLGMIAMGGPPVVLWLMAHDWSAVKTRAFMAALFLLAAPVQVGLLWWKLGEEVAPAFAWGLGMIPLVVAGSLLGIRLGNRLDRIRLRRAIMVFLFLTALVSLLSPYLSR